MPFGNFSSGRIFGGAWTGVDVFSQLQAQGAMIERLTSDSRRCGPGTAFFAYPGEHLDGRNFIEDAIRAGASAILWEANGFDWPAHLTTPNLAVRDLKAVAGKLAHQFFGKPSEELWVCGVTGTNGKTTSSQWLAACMGEAGICTAVVGTLGSGFQPSLVPTANTTPDALEIHRLLANMRNEGAAAIAMEVSSHGLAQSRVAGIAFDCALFTNLSHDHLEFHGTMQAYAASKMQLFEMHGLKAAVLNMDDVLGVQIAGRLAGREVKTIGYALSLGSLVPGSVHEFIAAREILPGARGTSIEITSSYGDGRVELNHLGRFNVANSLGVLGCLLAYGIEFDKGLELLGRLPAVPGRMQILGESGDPLVVIDYAHTPDALEKALQALRPFATARGGRLVSVFGAGGERDHSKRPIMGAIAARHADRVLLTSDNPRGEQPEAIINEILSGATGQAGIDVEPNRGRAVELAIRASASEDVVLIAGKGHEAYQEIAGIRHPYSDLETARAAIHARRAEQHGSAEAASTIARSGDGVSAS